MLLGSASSILSGLPAVWSTGCVRQVQLPWPQASATLNPSCSRPASPHPPPPQGQILGLKGAASHLVGRIPYFSINNNLIFDVMQVGAEMYLRVVWGTNVHGEEECGEGKGIQVAGEEQVSHAWGRQRGQHSSPHLPSLALVRLTLHYPCLACSSPHWVWAALLRQ